MSINISAIITGTQTFGIVRNVICYGYNILILNFLLATVIVTDLKGSIAATTKNKRTGSEIFFEITLKTDVWRFPKMYYFNVVIFSCTFLWDAICLIWFDVWKLRSLNSRFGAFGESISYFILIFQIHCAEI